MKTETAPLSLGTENISKLLIKYAIPAIVAMLATSLYNVTDSIFIGHGVGVDALSGLSITFPIMNLSVAFGSLIGVGAAALLSIRLGQKDYEAANYILANVVLLNIIIGVLLSVLVLFFLDPILIFFGASPKTLPHAHDFMVIIMIGNIIPHIYMGLNALIRSEGYPKKAMIATIITILINLILNPLFIFKFDWGIQGSAFATVISQTLVLSWQIYFFTTKDSFMYFQKKFFSLKTNIIKGIFSIGLSPFILNVLSCVVIILINKNLSIYGGDLAVGAYGIVNRVLFVLVMIVLGLNQGMQPIAGYNYGAGLYHRVTEVLKKTTIIAVGIMTFGSLIAELFPQSVSSLFTSDRELISVTSVGMRYVLMTYCLVGFQTVAITFFQSIGKAYISIILSLSRQAIILIPLLLIIPKYFGVTGVWLTMPIADLGAFIATIIVMHYQYKIFRRNGIM
ncbi:MAG: MATE family efflux transporter [Endomicrobium sp.]|jgi:putative MATE family efflux protein|nr:MATE family efflux transporter [Endomicrobium sp.]